MTRGILAALCAALAVLTCIPAVAEAVEVSATACVLMDADTGQVLYEKNGDKRMLIASTTKLMTALVALELGEPSQVITVTAAHMAEGSSMYLRPGERLTLEELLYGLLLCSGNDAALALTECAGGVAPFVERMNEKAAALGMRNSHFANPNGLDDEAHYSTAYDMALLGCAAVYMNWRYTDNIQKNAGKTLGQTTLVSSQDGEKGTEPTAAPAEDDYFATARLSRKQARDNAISMLREAESDENAQQSVLNEASQTLQVLAAYTVAESQIESLVTAKGYADCVVFMGAESVSVVVAPPEGGLTATDAARIKDIVISETDYTAEQIKIMEAN